MRVYDRAYVQGISEVIVPTDGRDTNLTFSIDIWNVTFPAAGDYSIRILVNGSERKRLPLLLQVREDLHVDLTGWAVPVYSGRLSDELLEELNGAE